MNTTSLQKHDEKLKRRQNTKNYDAVSNKISKLLSATAQTFIPELCEALTKDWHPKMTQEQIKNDKQLRDEIRDKILEDWSYDYNVLKGHNIWSELTIKTYFPDWLRNPTQQDSQTEALELAREAKINKKLLISEREKQNLLDTATNLPSTVIVPEPKEKTTTVEDDDDERWEQSIPSKYREIGEKGKTVSEQLREIRAAAITLFQRLTEKRYMPAQDDDIILDFIKPTREFRKGLILELDEHAKAHLYNDLGAVDAAVQDMLEILEQNKKKNK